MKPNHISYESAGSSTFVTALKIFGYSALAGIMCLFMYFSVNMLSDGLFQQPTVYRVHEVVNGETVTTEWTWEEYQEQLKTNPEQFEVQGDRRIAGEAVLAPKNELCRVLLGITRVLTQLLMLSVLVVMTGYYVWVEGDRDRNLVTHHERAATPLRGLWIGLIAAAPAVVLYVVLLAGKCNLFAADSILGLYRMLNPTFLPLINALISEEVASATQLNVWQLLALLATQIVTPVTCAVAYLLGFHRILKPKKAKKK